ncbi:hypothetical protein JB92DRAFT_2894846 [Gautieria morchelliformis]|nr:hypothetical protein JB92DRAFT_2894846 [Gautieria morchelliformis]
MAKFINFRCGTLAMGISISHVLVDCVSFIKLLKEWARVCRGDSESEPLAITSWERDPGIFFPPPTPRAIPKSRPTHGSAAPPQRPRAVTIT